MIVERKRLNILCTIILTLFFIKANGQKYVPVDKGTKIEFSLNGKGSSEKIKGKFSSLSGDIVFDPLHPEQSIFDIVINARDANTGNTDNDAKLKTVHYFSASMYPYIRLRSTTIKKEQSGIQMYSFSGILTIKGVSKPVHMQFTATPFASGYLFRGMMHINRVDFGVGSIGEMGEEVTIFIEVKTKKK